MGGGANEIGQQANSARHPLISDILPVQGILCSPNVHHTLGTFRHCTLSEHPPVLASRFNTVLSCHQRICPPCAVLPTDFQNKNTGLSFFPVHAACVTHLKNSTDTHYRHKYSCPGTNRLYVYGGRCEAPFFIQIHSRPASYTYTPRSSPRYNCFL